MNFKESIRKSLRLQEDAQYASHDWTYSRQRAQDHQKSGGHVRTVTNIPAPSGRTVNGYYLLSADDRHKPTRPEPRALNYNPTQSESASPYQVTKMVDIKGRPLGKTAQNKKTGFQAQQWGQGKYWPSKKKNALPIPEGQVDELYKGMMTHLRTDAPAPAPEPEKEKFGAGELEKMYGDKPKKSQPLPAGRTRPIPQGSKGNANFSPEQHVNAIHSHLTFKGYTHFPMEGYNVYRKGEHVISVNTKDANWNKSKIGPIGQRTNTVMGSGVGDLQRHFQQYGDR